MLLTGLARRNAEYHTITSQLAREFVPTAAIADSEAAITALLDGSHSLFWAGDLNYRLECGRAAADDLIAAGDFAGLQKHDQLLSAIAWKDVFAGLTESPIAFPPTYKFDPDSDAYDTSKKQRVPSWTDRVLYKAHPGLVVLAYAAAQNIRTSDHRPVHASFSVAVELGDANASAGDTAGRGKQEIGQNTSQVCAVM